MAPTPAFGCSPAICARLVTAVTALAEGYDIGCISGALVILRAHFRLTAGQEGAIAGVAYFGMAVGAPLGGLLADLAGRKRALGATYVLLMLGSLGMAFADSFETLFAGRLLLGVGIGAGFAVVTAFMTEVAPAASRGRLVGLEDFFLVTGLIVGYSCNYFLFGVRHDWRLMLGLGFAPALAAFLMLLHPALPESPRWLLLQGRGDLATESLVQLVGTEEAQRMLQEWAASPPAALSEVFRPQGAWRRRAVLAGAGVLVLSMASGIGPVTVYMGSLFAHELPPDQSFLMTALVSLPRLAVMAFSVFFLVDGVGRRPMLLLSLAGVVASMTMLAVFYWAGAPMSPFKLLAFFAFLLSFSVGLAPIPWVYAAEVMPTDLRGGGLALGMFLARLTASALVWLTPLASERIGLHGVFAVLACLNVLGLCLVWGYAPETAGASLEEMHKLFKPADDRAPCAEGLRANGP